MMSVSEGDIVQDVETGEKYEVVSAPDLSGADWDNEQVEIKRLSDGEWYGIFYDIFRDDFRTV